MPRAAGDAARFSFADLCQKPLGARDYLAIAARFSTIFIDHVPVPVFCKDAADLRYIFLNRAMASLVGPDLDAMVGRTDFDIYPPDQAACCSTAHPAAARL